MANGKSGTRMKDLALAFGGGILTYMALQWLALSMGRGRVAIDFGGSQEMAMDDDNLSRGYLGIAGVSGTQGYDEPQSDFQRTYNPMTASFLDAGNVADNERTRYFGSIYDDLNQPFAKMYDPGNPAQIFLQHKANVNNW